MNNTNYVESFKSFLIDVKGSSANTVSSYIRDITAFVKYYDASGRGSLSACRKLDVEKYLETLRSQGKSASTVLRNVSSIKSFFAYMVGEKICSRNPVLNISAEKSNKPLPGILSTKDVNLLLEQPDLSDFKGCRDKAMLELLYATGIRVTELIDLNIDDVRFDASLLRCSSKGKERLIPIYQEALNVLAHYVKNVRGRIIADDNESALFVNMNGTRMSRQGFWKVIKYYQGQAGIEGDITPHTLRHSFAAHLLENGADIKSIQEMLGHADVSSTQVYNKVVKKQLKDVYNRAHPKA